MREQRQLAAMAQRLAQQNKRSLYYMFEEQALLRGDSACIWYRPTGDGAAPDTPPATSSWRETYDSVNRYAQFLLDNHVAPGDFVATYLMNSPDFIHHLLGSWAIGAAPALVNYHLTGEGLAHCLKVASSKILVVDGDEGCQQRVQQVRPQLEELGIRVVVSFFENHKKKRKKERKKREYSQDKRNSLITCRCWTQRPKEAFMTSKPRDPTTPTEIMLPPTFPFSSSIHREPLVCL